MNYRSRTDIACTILDIAKDETNKTKIMHKAFLNHKQLKEYLFELIEKNLLEYLDGAQTFKTTQRGLNFLKMKREIVNLLTTINQNN